LRDLIGSTEASDLRLVAEKQMKFSDSTFILVGRVVAGLASLSAVIITARYVGPEIFGFCSVLIISLIFCMGIIDFGACAWAARELAAQKMSILTFKNVMYTKTRMNLFWLVLIPIFVLLVDSQFTWACILFAYPFLWNRFNYIQQFLVANNQEKKSVKLIIFERMSWFMIIPLDALNVEKNLAFGSPILLGLALHNLLGIKDLSVEKDREIYVKEYTFVELFSESRQFGLTSISSSMINLDGFIVASIGSLTDSANYVLAQRFRNPLALVFSSFSTTVKPIAAKRDFNLIKIAVRDNLKFLAFGLVANLIFSILTYFYSDMFLGASFKGINLLMFFGTLTSIPVGILLILGNILSYFGAEKFVARATMVYVVLLLIMIGIFTHFYGSLGAVISVFIISLAYTFCSAIMLIKLIKTDENSQN
jgi:O-antigen/teichoic acid export membrane protein